MNNDFALAYKEGIQDFSRFSGTIYKYPFSSFSSLFKESCVQNFDEIVICDIVPVVNGGSGSGGGGGGDGTGYDPTGNEDGYYDGSTGGSGGSVIINGWKCDRWGVLHDAPTSCGTGVWIITFLSHHKSSSTSSNKALTCCDDSYVEGSVGVNILVNAVSDIYDCIGTTSSEMGVLGSIENALQTIQLSMYLKNNNCSEEAKEFGALAKEAIVAGSEVDYQNKIIYTAAVPECTKDMIKELLNDNTFLDLGDMPDFVKQELNLSGYILNLFENSDNYNLIFDAKPNMVNQDNIPVNANTDVEDRDPNNPYKHTFRITLNSDYIENGTDLALARTIIHESLHAYFKYIYQDQITSNLGMALNYLFSTEGYNDPNAVHHKLMTQQFVESIANSLENWDNNSLTDNNYYYYISWSGGMLNSTVFDALDEIIQGNIESANFAEGDAINPSNINTAQSSNTCQ